MLQYLEIRWGNTFEIKMKSKIGVLRGRVVVRILYNTYMIF